jgi:oxygen-independent coproporphyrinogen III oxidase
MKDFGLYVHIPFCVQICPYCAFTSVAGKEELYGRYVEAVCMEICTAGHRADRRGLDTVFFGGGTPSILAPDQLGRIIEEAERKWGLAAGAEVTIEANPGTADQEKFRSFRAIGCNRLSIGVQSFIDEVLVFLGRVHNAVEAERAYNMGREAGFDNVSMDLIFSIPQVPPGYWQFSLERAAELGPEHISAYSLTIEEGTALARRLQRGSLEQIEEEDDARNFELASEFLVGERYEHYEVSNFARPGRRSRHNWGCWTGAEYLGVGLSAHSFVDGRRSWNTRDLDTYLKRVGRGESACEGEEEIDPVTALRERIWMGLRTCQGVFLTESQKDQLKGQSRFDDFVEAGFLEFSGEWLRLTSSGFVLADGLGVEVAELLEEGDAGKG